MATLTPRRSGWFSAKLAGRGFSKETASPLWGVTAWIVGLIAFFPVLYMFLTGFKSERAAVELPPTVHAIHLDQASVDYRRQPRIRRSQATFGSESYDPS